jgi:hypothetical protein
MSYGPFGNMSKLKRLNRGYPHAENAFYITTNYAKQKQQCRIAMRVSYVLIIAKRSLSILPIL